MEQASMIGCEEDVKAMTNEQLLAFLKDKPPVQRNINPAWVLVEVAKEAQSRNLIRKDELEYITLKVACPGAF
jgi:hypothetical protein